MIIEGKRENSDRLDTSYSVLEPVVQDNRKLMIARTLVDPFKQRIPVRLINLDDRPVKLRRNYRLRELHPIAYTSETLDTSQQRYSVTRKELLAMVTFIHQFKHYLLGRKCILRTDHGALKWLCNFKDTQGQLARWIETLAQYNFEIHLRAGIKHYNADTLSRIDYTTKLCTHQQNEECDASCESCKNIVYQWKDFKLEIDNMQNLSKTNKNNKPSKI
jgi:hypothetical protein